ncbi:MAG: hypothetical protein ACR2JQ_01055 [Mycobacteriales bacterium]
MRWERLFADLEAQAEAAAAGELAGEVASRTRHEVGTLRLVDRLRPAIGAPVRITCDGAEEVAGALRAVGADWLLVSESSGREAVVALGHVCAVSGTGALSAVPGSEGKVTARLGLRNSLRGIARDRAPVRVLTSGGPMAGTIDRVGADFIEIALHAQGEARRARSVLGVRAVPIAAIILVRSGAAAGG